MTPHPPVPFFVGCERSGTTLLRAIFDSHPELAVAEEFNFAYSLSTRAERYEGPRFDVDSFVTDVVSHPFFFRWKLSPEAVHQGVRSMAPRTYEDAVRAVYTAYAQAHGKSRYGDKAPRYVIHITRLSELIAEARFVHIIRDGREVALSLRDVRWGPRSVEEAAMMWRNRVSAGRIDGTALGAERYLEVRYEELIERPEDTVRKLCRFIELPFDDAMMSYFERASDLLTTKRFPDEHTRIFLPPTKGLRDWRKDMPVVDRAIFESVAGDVLSGLGYELEGGALSAGGRARSRAKRAGVVARWMVRRMRRVARRRLRHRKGLPSR